MKLFRSGCSFRWRGKVIEAIVDESKRRLFAVLRPLQWGFLVLLLCLVGCRSEMGFRRFELGKVDPHLVLETAREVVSEFYSQVHGGIQVYVDEENLRLWTGYIKKRLEVDFVEDEKRVASSFETPSRQKFCLCVLPSAEEVSVEVFATYEVLSIEDPDAIKTSSDIWKFVGQDEEVEDLLVQALMERLVEKGHLD